MSARGTASAPAVDRTHRYMFGLKLFSLANMALNGVKLREQAAPFLQSLIKQSRLAVHMAVLERDEGVLIDKVEPPGFVRLATWVGRRLELHCSAVGKCLLADLEESEFVRLVVAAISVAGTTAEIKMEDFAYFGAMVRQTAPDVSEALGFHPAQKHIGRTTT